MQPLYDHNAPRKATNLSVNSDLLKKSRSLNINLSAVLEQGLRSELAKTAGEKWRNDNKEAITQYNRFIEKSGCFGDEYRHF
jgi:antitoxin CcdA